MRILLSLALILLGSALFSGCVVMETTYIPRLTAESAPASQPAVAQAAEGGRVRLWPIYYSAPVEGGGRHRQILWPFFQQHKTSTESMTQLLPLFVRGKRLNENNTTSTGLFSPIFVFLENNKPVDPTDQAPILRKRRGFWPLYQQEITLEGRTGETIVLVPFFRQGWDQSGNYLRLWPLPKWYIGGVE